MEEREEVEEERQGSRQRGKGVVKGKGVEERVMLFHIIVSYKPYGGAR